MDHDPRRHRQPAGGLRKEREQGWASTRRPPRTRASAAGRLRRWSTRTATSLMVTHGCPIEKKREIVTSPTRAATAAT